VIFIRADSDLIAEPSAFVGESRGNGEFVFMDRGDGEFVDVNGSDGQVVALGLESGLICGPSQSEFLTFGGDPVR
jgi:hypothetical protein